MAVVDHAREKDKCRTHRHSKHVRKRCIPVSDVHQRVWQYDDTASYGQEKVRDEIEIVLARTGFSSCLRRWQDAAIHKSWNTNATFPIGAFAAAKGVITASDTDG